MTDALGRQTDYTSDTLGNRTSVTRMAGTPEAVTTTVTYEPIFSRLTSLTDPLTHTTTFEYDSRGALSRIRDPLGHETTLTTNGAGQPTAVTTPAGTTQLGYDFGDLATITDPLGRVTRRFVDAAGRLLSLTDPLGRQTRYEYDVLNRLTKVTDPLGGTTTFTYDGNGNLLTVTDARNNVTQYTYDSMDRVATRKDPLLRIESYQYDAAGNLTRVTDRKNQVTTFTYDPLQRRTGTTYQGGSTTSYGYDAGNRLRTITDSLAGTISRTYDNLDRPTQETTSQGTVSYGYDAAGRRTALTVAGQPPVTYAYDNADRVSQITQGSATVGYEYDAANRRTALMLPNGVRAEYAYDAASQLTGLTYKLGPLPLGDLAYTYDAAGQRTQAGGTWARTGLPQPVSAASYDGANQQLVFGAKTLTYDANGNLTTLTDPAGTTTFTWDPRNRLTALSGPAGTASFGYDGLGRRWTKTVNLVRTDVLYDGLNPVQERGADGLVLATLLTGLRLDEYFTRSDVTGTASVLPDALGSTVALTNALGAVTTEYTYEPFGATTAVGAPSTNASQYTGRENDGTGLYYYRARYYHPTLQRFMSEDPILTPPTSHTLWNACGLPGSGFWPLPLLIRSQPQEVTKLLNPYVYVANDPLNRRDPRGLISEAECLGVCRVAYFVVCDLLCAPFLELGPAWVACNAACFYASELICHDLCRKK